MFIARLYIGTGTNRHNNPVNPEAVEPALKALTRRLSTAFGGTTIIRGHGTWLDKDVLVSEPSAIVEVVYAGDPFDSTWAPAAVSHLRAAAQSTRESLNQSSIMLVLITDGRVTQEFVTDPN
jgi:hypothetical protein